MTDWEKATLVGRAKCCSVVKGLLSLPCHLHNEMFLLAYVHFLLVTGILLTTNAFYDGWKVRGGGRGYYGASPNVKETSGSKRCFKSRWTFLLPFHFLTFLQCSHLWVVSTWSGLHVTKWWLDMTKYSLSSSCLFVSITGCISLIFPSDI